MSDVITVARRVTNVDVSPRFDNYSKVIIRVSDEAAYEAGNDTGRTLEIDNPFGTQQMADNILESLRGKQYQPYAAQGALLDPAAEIGDAINIRGTYGGIYTRSRTFGRLMKADVSAPHDEEINHEYQFESHERREFKRSINEVKASLIIANDNIEAKVSQESPEGQTSFSWKLLADSHKWYANGNEVMSVDADGLKVTGEVQATSGKIGNFNISATAIWNNLSSYGGSQTTGVYIGTDGIQLGQNFKVDTSGKTTLNSLVANNATINGTLMVGGSPITAAALRSGAQSAFTNGGTWTTGAGYGRDYNNATKETGGSYPAYFRANVIRATNVVWANQLQVGAYYASWKTKTISGTTINYLGY